MPKDAGLPLEQQSLEPVRKTIRVRANAARAFQVFTEGFDSWWPRSHHIGKLPMVRAVLDGRVGGRCYSIQSDGSECPWGRIVEWDPPRRFVMAWLIDGEWKYEPDSSRCSEVEVTFTPMPDNTTVVELEHRAFDRMISNGHKMRWGVSQEGGWGGLLQLFQSTLESVQ